MFPLSSPRSIDLRSVPLAPHPTASESTLRDPTGVDSWSLPRVRPSPSLQSQISQSQEWSTAFSLWFESHPSPNTRRSYRKSWELFLSFTHKKTWQISKSDIASWVSDLRSQGLSPETTNLRLAALSSFYTYVTQTYTHLSPEGTEQPLYHYNPVKAVRRPKINPYGKARCLTIDQARAFLHSIPRWSPQGKRDYALFLAYLATGRRNSEIRLLRWGDFDQQDSWLVFYRWRGKGSQRQDYCPPPVWTAILDFLKSTNRLDSISPSDYIFTSLNNNAQYLPNVISSETSQFPLSSQMACRLLKKYLRRAGIDPTHITVHSLRHTAALLRKEAGDELHTISFFLGHSNLSITQIYPHNIKNHQDASWLKVEFLLGLS